MGQSFSIITTLISLYKIKFEKLLKSLFLPRVAEFIYIEGDNKKVCLLLEL